MFYNGFKGGNEMRGILVRAIESQTPLEMIYLSKDGSISHRLIRVIDLKDDRIKAFCFLRGKYRVFQLSSILSISQIRKKIKGA
jgi:predicted DNA-binding transcriptional regulator YafY